MKALLDAFGQFAKETAVCIVQDMRRKPEKRRLIPLRMGFAGGFSLVK